MQVFFTWFQDPKRLDFKRMKEVFMYSLKKHSPEIEIIEHETVYPKEKFKSSAPSHFENVYKLGIWNNIIQKAKEPVLLIDCDILILQDISVLETMDNLKDITLTTRTDKPYNTSANCNAGFIYVKPTKEAKDFFNEWYELSKNFDPKTNKWRGLYKKYKGATQTTLGYLREEKKYENNISEIPCYIWNCANLDYSFFNDKETKVVHIKSKLRKYILKDLKTTDKTILKLADKWFEYEKEMINSDPEKYKQHKTNIKNRKIIQKPKLRTHKS